jgi:hypothetical protein
LRRQGLFAGAFLAFAAFTALTVNPLYRGLGPVADSPLLETLEPYRAADPEARWLVYDSINYGNYLLANGYPVLSSIYLYPQYDLWLQFDPPGRYEDVWNRYAHVLFARTTDPSVVDFVAHNFDSFVVSIDPCHSVLADLRVRFMTFASEVHAPCLQRIAAGLQIGEPLYVYERLY